MQRPASHILTDSKSEDIDAKDVGATTLCVFLAAMDLAPVAKATSSMKLRSCSNQKNGLGTRTQRSASHLEKDFNSEVSSDVLENDITIDFEANQDNTNIHLEDFHNYKPTLTKPVMIYHLE